MRNALLVFDQLAFIDLMLKSVYTINTKVCRWYEIIFCASRKRWKKHSCD